MASSARVSGQDKSNPLLLLANCAGARWRYLTRSGLSALFRKTKIVPLLIKLIRYTWFDICLVFMDFDSLSVHKVINTHKKRDQYPKIFMGQ